VASTAPIRLPYARDAEIAHDAGELGVAIELVRRGVATRITLVGLEFADEVLAEVAQPSGIGIARRRQIGGRTALIVGPAQT
jgi:hypothetical protein